VLAGDIRSAVHRVIEEIYNQGNLDGLDQLYARDVLYHRPPLADIEGLGPLGEYVADLRRAFSEVRYTLHEIALEGVVLACRWTFQGRHTGRSPSMPIPPTGREVTITGCSMAHCVQGRIEEEWSYADWLGFFQQLNVIPPMG
jgi:predicted ester cyclase